MLDRAGVTAEQRTRVKKAQELLKSLPAGAAPELKRQIVEVAFQAFDISTAEIVRAASSEIDALEAYVASGDAVKQRALEQGNARVKELEQQIAEVRAQLNQAVAAQEGRATAARKEVARIQPVLEFFVAEGRAKAAEARPPADAPARPRAPDAVPTPAPLQPRDGDPS